MNINELKAQHPEAYAEAVQMGVDQERDRVTGHLIMGEASGDMNTASSAIKEGEIMTATLNATYMAAGLNRRDIVQRQDEDAEATAGDQAEAIEGRSDSDFMSAFNKELGV